ncbi:NUDIX hydrolase [Aestuariibaculum sediminum]|uniref:NUDIX domain-containing protein n=1 Tax=Aestuariibaculum sediminum TaxID=2770637 RepID=A0A8J6Q2E2_9FLAO|nr:NUDIX domain-containing protein [Aestuariibaculum sediminum]MBD0831760.1 NUDIX domain-containing protein [Aestuariibaculum sediminum]
MIEEYIDIVDENGFPTGKSELKSVIHQKGYYHNTVHIWFYTTNREILLAQRSAKKSICPLMWDVSVAGHIDAGESIKKAAQRETKEEIGLNISQDKLKKVGVFKCFQSYDNGLVDNEFHHTYICKLEQPIESLILQEEEVEALKLVSLDEYQYLIDHIGVNNHFVPSNKTYYQTVLNFIKNS